MKKAGILVLCGLVAAMLVGYVGSVDARPNYPKVFGKVEGFKNIEKEATEAKCNVCHYGKDKKNRNDFGKALVKGGLKKEAYNEVLPSIMFHRVSVVILLHKSHGLKPMTLNFMHSLSQKNFKKIGLRLKEDVFYLPFLNYLYMKI